MRPRDARSSLHRCESPGVFARGSSHDVKGIIEKAFPGGVRQDASAEKFLDPVQELLIDHKSEARSAIATTARTRESFKLQLRKCLKSAKSSNASALAPSPFDTRELRRKCALRTPTGCVPRDDCESAKQLARALGQSNPSTRLLARLDSGRPLELCKAHQEK